MQRVIKRNGQEVEFNRSKIVEAISCANNEILKSKQIGPRKISQIVDIITEKCAQYKRAINVDDINNMVEDELIHRNYNHLVRAFIKYRYNKDLIRKSNTTDESILSLINLSNEEIKQENSNKNPVINSTQRDYMAGEVSKDLSRRVILPKDVIKAHDEGILHFHDMDYFAQKMYNCFHSKTRFITSRGVRAFKDCSDGEELLVLTKDGEWKPATVRCYGKREMQNVTLVAGKTRKTIKCTSDHRWVLSDGSITTQLSAGDTLFALSEVSPIISNPDAFCLGFILGDGTDLTSQTSSGVKVRLCGEKIKYLDTFIKAGYRVSNSKYTNGDICVTKLGAISKSEFITARCWNYLSMEDKISLFLGYYAADGAKDTNILVTSNEYLAQMIRDISALAGYHITSENTIIHDTNYKKDAILFKFHFMKHQQPNHLWKVESIEPDRHGPIFNAWCVEEPSTHTFTLEGGIVTGNCCLINLEDMLQNGTVVSGTLIEKPHSFSTACNVATQIVAQVSSNQYGGQSITLAHLAPFVDASRQKIRAEVYEEQKKAAELFYGEPVPVSIEVEKLIDEITEKRVRAEVKRGVQTIQYQVNTLLTTNGQAPFITVFMYLGEVHDERTKKDLAMIIEETLLQRYEGVKNEKGVWITPAFPKLIYVLEEDNVHENSEFFYLTKLAAKCSAKRLVPDYVSEKIMKEIKEGGCFPPMGCRSMLSAWYDEDGKQKWYGRMNKGVVTVNLVDVACGSAGENYNKDLDSFWKNFDEVLELCHKALLCRYERLKGTISDVAPILWQHGAIARLKKGETIDKLLTGGYSTISLGYAGLWECVVELIGKDLCTEEGQELGLEIMRYMNKKCDEWNKELYLGFGIYGTPLESTTYKFAKCLQKRYGEIPGVTDKNYITNSYHVHVEKAIDPFEKLRIESKFQRLSTGGAISYIESANLENNLEAVITVIQYIYDNIMYAELNTKSDYCQVCGWDREIMIVEDESGKLVWECPNCGNRDQSKMNVARRTCGYIGTQYWSQGRTAEIRDRYVHLDCHDCC